MRKDANGPLIDMTLEGEILTPKRPSLLMVLLRLAVFGLVLAAVGAALWMAVMLLPLLLLLVAGAYFWLRPRGLRF